MDIPITERAWAAGFFDGEGTTHLAKSTDGHKRTKPKLTLPQKTPDLLVRFQNAIGGYGTIYGPINNGTEGGIYHFSIQNAAGVDTALNALWPFLSEAKRKQALRTGFVPGEIRRPKVGRPKKERS